jgi:hypothetical protein
MRKSQLVSSDNSFLGVRFYDMGIFHVCQCLCTGLGFEHFSMTARLCCGFFYFLLVYFKDSDLIFIHDFAWVECYQLSFFLFKVEGIRLGAFIIFFYWWLLTFNGF